ncbi:MAG: ABC transporter ATP-binding protein [Oscillospiraceae bacterium]|nr:ABC transporter ATP-binding protein [Oscillospiraceae bacterium]
MMGEKLKRKYALTDKGLRNTRVGAAWTVVVNLIMMAGMGILYLLMQKYMNTLTDGAALPNAWGFIGLVAAFVVLSFVTHLQQYRNTYGLVYREIKDTRITLAERLRRLPLGYFGKRDLADLTETIMGDVNRLEHVWSHCLGYLYGAYVSTAIIAVMLFLYDWRMAIACLWGVPVAFILLFGSRKIHKRRSEKLKADALAVSDNIQESLENVREIRATNREKEYLDKLNKKIDRLETTMKSGELVIGLFVNGASVIMRLGVATTILTGASLILSGKIDFMLLFMFLMVITRVYAPFDQALALIAEMFVSQVSANRLNEIKDTPIAEGSELFRPDGHDVTFENVSFAYDDHEVLRGVSFTAKEGEVTALVGPSGSGKSTCARLAARLWDIQSGTIRVGGVDISTIDPEVLLADYSMVFQDVVLFDDTVMENIRLGKHGATDEEVLAAAKAANCDEFVERLPKGYQTSIGENGAKLSGGERQRISIARALLKNAPIVLLDEATASLDVENETRVQSALSRLLEGKTVLVIAHRMRTVESADQIVVLKDGKVAEQGSPAELLQNPHGVFVHMHALQSASAGWHL